MSPDTCRVTGVFRPIPRKRPLGKKLRVLELLLISFPIRPCDFVTVDIYERLSLAGECEMGAVLGSSRYK